MDRLKVGGVWVDRGAAVEYAHRYLMGGQGWAYPSYDGFDLAGARGPLVDADLLAPVLLNVPWIGISTYEALQRARPALQEVLDTLPPDLGLADAGPGDIQRLGELFAVLDHHGMPGARGTILSKVLHRKRPALIPLYDEQVRHVYQDGEEAPVPTERGRSWQEFEPMFAAAVQVDLIRELPFWEQLAAVAPGPPITALRALDIVAWWAGSRHRVPPGPA